MTTINTRISAVILDISSFLAVRTIQVTNAAKSPNAKPCVQPPAAIKCSQNAVIPIAIMAAKSGNWFELDFFRHFRYLLFFIWKVFVEK